MAPAKKASRKATTNGTRKGSASRADFDGVFSILRGLLTPYEDRLAFKAPKPGYCYVESRTPTHKNRPMYFAGVRLGKNYVSYYLMSIYASPDFLKTMSPELKKSMQGKACFNFTEIDQELLKELGRLTEAGYHKFKSMKYV